MKRKMKKQKFEFEACGYIKSKNLKLIRIRKPIPISHDYISIPVFRTSIDKTKGYKLVKIKISEI